MNEPVKQSVSEPADEGTSDAITIVAIHGNGGGAFRFSLVPVLEPGSDGISRTLKAMTLPGFQGRPLPAGPIGLSTFTTAVTQELAAIPGRRVLLGHGIGGSIALDVVANDPTMADGLILLSPVGVKLDERLFPKIMSKPLVRRAAKAIISSPVMQATAGRFLFNGAPRQFAKRFLAEYRNADAFEVMFDLLNATWFDSLPPVEIPVAIVWGEKDRVLDVSHVEAYESAISNTIRVVKPDWGHYPMIEQPEDFAVTIADVAQDLIS